jgi:hypothetical protein
LSKKLQDTTPDEIKQMTLESYTQFKIDFIEQTKDQKI